MPALTAATLDIGANGQWKATQATITADKPAWNSSATWNAGAVSFTHLKANVTDTASAAASLLIDLQVGGVSQFKVSKAGALTAGTYNGQTITSAASLTGTLAVAGAVTLSSTLAVTGNVGIGVAADAAVPLTVSKSVSGSAIVSFTNTNATDGYGGYFKTAANDTTRYSLRVDGGGGELMRVVSSGQVLIGTTVTGSVAAGELALANGKAVRGINAAGALGFPLIQANGDNKAYIGDVANGYYPAIGFRVVGDHNGGSAAMNGSISIDSTNNRFIYYSGGNRYYLTGTAF